MPELEIQKTTKAKGAAVLLYGIPGIGKTTLIGTGGAGTFIMRPPDDHTHPIEGSGVDEVVVHSWDEVDGVWRWIQQGGYKEYEWFWVDSLSLLQDVGLKDLYDKAVERNSNRAEYGLDKSEYGINQFRITSFIRNMVGLADEGKINFGVVCHTMEWWNPMANEQYWAPNIQGREGLMMQKICGMMNTVAYYYTVEKNGKTTRVLRTKQVEGQNIFVKDQLGFGTKGRILNPTMADINKVTNTAKTTTRPKRRRKVNK